MNPKNIILTAIILISLFAVAVSANATPELREDELLNPGTTPDSSFYFLKTWKESIQTFFTFGLENKARQYLHLAEVRLAEYQKMIDKGKTKIAEKTLTKYEKQLNRALEKAETMKQKGKETKDLTQKLEQTVSKHLDVLEKNLEKSPEAARKGIEKAIESSGKAIEKITGKPKQDQTAGWNTYRDERYGLEFKYPTKVANGYIGTPVAGWPPSIINVLTETDLICEENPNLKTTEGYGKQGKIKINGTTYCVTIVSEGAAGTKFVTHKYLAIKNSKLITLMFVLSYPNCGNIADANEIEKCEAEQKAFDPNKLADQIFSTFRFISQ